MTCAPIFNELAEKLSIKLGLPSTDVDETLADYLSFHRLIEIPGLLDAVPRDPEDNAVLECAQLAGAQFVVTGDQDLLSLGTFEGIEIITATEFLQRWESLQHL